jgi:ATP-dependent helicase HrpA
VVGFQRATLYGLTVIQRRKVAWAPLGPSQQQEAREIFIRQALVEQDWDCSHRFFAVNRSRIREIEALEHKSRRPDILVDEHLLFAFYDQQIPESVVDADSFDAWYRQAVRQNAELLCLKKEDLMRHEAAGITTDQFPKVHRQDQRGQSFALEYHFEPGDARDGVTLLTSAETLIDLDPVPMEWLVPGMLREKVQGLLKSLPQRIRRHCVPLPEYAEAFCQRWADRAGSMPLITALAKDIAQQTGIAVRRDEFKLDGLSPHCRMNIRVLDPHGRRLAEGRDVELLVAELGLRREPSESLPGGMGREQWIGRFVSGSKEAFKALEKEINSRREIGIAYSSFGSHEQLITQFQAAVIGRVFLAEGLPQSDDEFQARLAAGRSRVMLIGQELLRWLAAVLTEAAGLQKKIAGLKAFRSTQADLEAQFGRLLAKDFMTAIPADRAAHLPRYLKAMASRLEKCRADSARDQRWAAEVASVEAGLWRWAAQHRGPWPDRMIEFRWMVEELRVALFAQELKTPMPVSVKRLQKAWAALQE